MEPSLNLPPLNIPDLLRSNGLSPKVSLGQNFLIDPSALQKVVEAAGVGSQDEVLEIGPGLGSLTRYLAVSARKVVAVEIDQNIIPLLENVVRPFNNVIVIHNDILKVYLSEWMQPGYRVVANIPYYITSAVIRHLLESTCKPSCLVITIQREVAERICVSQGSMSLLALSVQVYGRPQIKAHIPAGAFFPVPKVDSSVLRVDLFDKPLIPTEQLETFFRLAKAGFSQKRKTLRNALSAGLVWKPDFTAGFLTDNGIHPQRRAETLSLDEWALLTSAYLRQAV